MDNGNLVADFADADFVTIRPFPHPTQMAVMPVVAMKGRLCAGGWGPVSQSRLRVSF